MCVLFVSPSANETKNPSKTSCHSLARLRLSRSNAFCPQSRLPICFHEGRCCQASASKKSCFWHHCRFCFNFCRDRPSDAGGGGGPAGDPAGPVGHEDGHRQGATEAVPRQGEDATHAQSGDFNLGNSFLNKAYLNHFKSQSATGFFGSFEISFSASSGPRFLRWVCLGRGSLTRMIGIFFFGGGWESGRRDFLPFLFAHNSDLACAQC